MKIVRKAVQMYTQNKPCISGAYDHRSQITLTVRINKYWCIHACIDLYSSNWWIMGVTVVEKEDNGFVFTVVGKEDNCLFSFVQ